MIIDRCQIDPAHRGKGYGLCAASLLIDYFGPSSGLVACIPAAYELKDGVDNPAWKPAQEKLRRYWALLGFIPVPQTDIFVLSTAHRQPSLKDAMNTYREHRKLAEKRGTGNDSHTVVKESIQ